MSPTAPAHPGSVLVVNSGSSSIKYQLVDPVGGEAIASGIVERIGEDEGSVRHTYGGSTTTRTDPVADHGAGLRAVLALFAEVGPDLTQAHVVGVGHRVVHGGAVFGAPVVVDDEVVAQIDALSPLAPLHNPPNLTGIQVARELHALVESGDEDASLALDVYLHRLRKYIGAYYAVLGRVDVITFTAGVGENDDIVRARALEGLEPLGIAVDPERNAGRKKEPTIISPDWTSTLVMVVPTNEELAIARQAIATIEAAGYEGTSDESDPAPAATGHA